MGHYRRSVFIRWTGGQTDGRRDGWTDDVDKHIQLLRAGYYVQLFTHVTIFHPHNSVASHCGRDSADLESLPGTQQVSAALRGFWYRRS